jgi:DNA-binding MarR family transcriptional regulator
VKQPFLEAFTAALHPVFLAATGFAVAAFLLTWLLREVPLRATAAAEGIGESFASPRDDSSLRELQRAVSSLASSENRWEAYERFAARAGVSLRPPELWLLARIAEREPVGEDVLRNELGDAERVSEALIGLEARGFVYAEEDVIRLTSSGEDAMERVRTAWRQGLDKLLEGWAPERHAEIRRMADELARSFASDLPRPATAAP